MPTPEEVKKIKITDHALKRFLLRFRGRSPLEPEKVLRKTLQKAVEISCNEGGWLWRSREWTFIVSPDKESLITCYRFKGRGNTQKMRFSRERARQKRKWKRGATRDRL